MTTNISYIPSINTSEIQALSNSSETINSEFNKLEEQYWFKKYNLSSKNSSSINKTNLEFNSIIESISTCSTNNRLAIASGPRVSIHDTLTLKKPLRQIPFNGPVYCTAFRNDGRIIAVGGENGLLRLVDVETRATLRSFQCSNSNSIIRVITWLGNGQDVLSGCDDGRMYQWSLMQQLGIESQKPKQVFVGHGDSIRAIEVLRIKKKYYCCTASYDHTIRIWDLEKNACHCVIRLSAPVEAIKVYSHDKTFHVASVSNVTLQIHDGMTGDFIKSSETHHAKTITCLLYESLDNGEERFITAGIDGFVRFHDVHTLTTVHGYKHPSAISAVSIYNNLFLIGAADGTVTIFSPSSLKRSLPVAPEPPKKGTFNYYNRIHEPSEYDIMIKKPKKFDVILKRYDVFLRQFQYVQALDAALKQDDVKHVSNLVQELAKRHALVTALSNRDAESLGPILKCCIKNISNPDHSLVFIDVSLKILEIYGDLIGQHSNIDRQFTSLRKVVRKEINAQFELMKFNGQLNMVLSSI